MRAEKMPCAVSPPSFVLIAQAVFLLERGHTQTHTQNITDATDNPTHAPGLVYLDARRCLEQDVTLY